MRSDRRKYDIRKLGEELNLQLDQGYDITRISRWAYRLSHDHCIDLDDETEEIIDYLSMMEDDPQFEYTENELRFLADKIIKNEKNVLKSIREQSLENYPLTERMEVGNEEQDQICATLYDAEISSYFYSYEDEKLIINIETWNAKHLEISFIRPIYFLEEDGDIIEKFVEKKNKLLKESINKKICEEDKKYNSCRLFQILCIDGQACMQIVCDDFSYKTVEDMYNENGSKKTTDHYPYTV